MAHEISVTDSGRAEAFFALKPALFRDQARHLAERRMEGNQARDYIAQLFPADPAASAAARTIRDRKLERIRANYRNGRQQISSIRDSWWAMFNAVTELVDHTQPKRGGSPRERQEKHMLSVLDGSGADFKQKAFELALALAG